MPNTKHDEGVVSRHLLTNTHEDPAPSNPAIGPNNPCQHCGGNEPISEIDGRCNYCFGGLILPDEAKTSTAIDPAREQCDGTAPPPRTDGRTKNRIHPLDYMGMSISTR